MPHQFPHLDDTGFPYANNIDAYKYHNTFDYHRWDPDTIIKVCNVPWDVSGQNVVKFEDDEARDKYFKSIPGDEQHLFEIYRMNPDGDIKLNIPYDVMQRYNYITVHLPVATSEGDPIDYETKDGVRDFFFFVTSTDATANSTTRCTLKLDEWTTYANRVKVSSMILERGHAPVAATDVDRYLSDPVNNSSLLLAEDVNFGEARIASSTRLTPWTDGSDHLVVLIATTYPRWEFHNNGQTAAATSEGTSYSDTTDRWGFQYQVNGYRFGTGGVDYGGLQTHVNEHYSVGGNLPNNVNVIAVDAREVYGGEGNFFADVRSHAPNVLQSFLAVFVVPSRFVRLGDADEFFGHMVYQAEPVDDQSLASLRLTRDRFGYPSEYAGLAKLYTFPYSRLEITDNAGHTTELRVEDMGRNPEVRGRLSFAYPFVKFQAFLTGTNGNTSSQYSWVHLDGSTRSREAFGNSLADGLMEWDIPTFGIFQSAQEDWQMRNWYSLQQERADAVNNYQTSTVQSNTSYQNTVSQANANQTNANNSASAAKSNANASNATARTNAANSADNMRANQEIGNAATLANIEASIAMNTTQTLFQNAHADTEAQQANSAQAAMTQITVDTMTSMTHVDQAKSGINAACGVIGAAATGDVAGAIGAAVGGITGAVTAGITNDIAVSKENMVSQLTQTRNTQNAGNTKAVNTNQNTWNNELNRENTKRTNESQTAMTNNSANLTTTNANNSANTGDANAGRTYDVSVANNNRSRDITVENAGYTQRDAENWSNKRAIEQLQADKEFQYNAHKVDGHISIGTTNTAGAAADAFEYRGVQIRVLTEHPSEIRQAGDAFLRYGYTLNQAWTLRDMNELRVMPRFAFWKAADIWLRGGQGVPETAQYDIRDMLLNGVTVWTRPEDIGRTSIYDNHD